MLVLTRRPEEKIVFPNLGITVQVIRIQGNVVRVGIEAPPEVRVLRHELVAQSAPEQIHRPGATLAHALCNHLNNVGMALHLLQRQLDHGRLEAANATLSDALTKLGEMDHAWVAAQCVGQPAPPPPAAQCRTLVVEDDTNERELLAGLLSMHGCECATAADGLDALDYLAAHDRPDFVLLDMRMPRCDGPRTLQHIRRDPRLGGLKVFAISGSPPDEFGTPTGPDGFDAWFPKPLNTCQLWDTMRQHLI